MKMAVGLLLTLALFGVLLAPAAYARPSRPSLAASTTLGPVGSHRGPDTGTLSVTAGDAIVVVVFVGTGGDTTVGATVSDSQSNTWTNTLSLVYAVFLVPPNIPAYSYSADIFTANARTTGSTTITVTYNATVCCQGFAMDWTASGGVTIGSSSQDSVQHCYEPTPTINTTCTASTSVTANLGVDVLIGVETYDMCGNSSILAVTQGANQIIEYGLPNSLNTTCQANGSYSSGTDVPALSTSTNGKPRLGTATMSMGVTVQCCAPITFNIGVVDLA